MDNILEILIPLAIAAVYFFGNMFSGKSSEDEDSPSSLPRSRDEGEREADAGEQQRRVQDEIRRKIMERRRAAEGRSTAETAAGQEFHERRREAEAHREAPAGDEVRREAEEQPSPYMESPYQGESEHASEAFSWEESDNAYENSMQAKLRRIEETKRKAEQLKKQAAQNRGAADGQKKRGRQRTGGYFTGTVRESLKDPQAARVAFIYGEVLGQPISLRKGSSAVPGLN